MSNNLYMPLYINDYLADAAHLTTLEHGAYLLLIMNYWQRGEALPSDDRKLAGIAKMTREQWAESRDLVLEFFQERDGCFHHGRIDAELEKAKEKSAKARGSANARYGNGKPTPSERSANAVRPQIECNANKDKEEDKVKEDASASSTGELADFRKGIMAAFHAAGSTAFPDTSRAAIWLENGWKPSVCLAVISEVLSRNKSVTALKYFEQPIADAHLAPIGKTPAPRFGAPPAVGLKPHIRESLVWVDEGSDDWALWMRARPGYVKSQLEERSSNGKTLVGAYLPSSQPIKQGAAA